MEFMQDYSCETSRILMTSRNQFRALLATCAILFTHSIGTAATQQPTSAKGSLHGVVKLARTGGPLAGARVTLSSTTQPAAPHRFLETSSSTASATTDINGEFVLEGLDPGSYRF